MSMLFEPVHAIYRLAVGPPDTGGLTCMSTEEKREFLIRLAVQIDEWSFVAHERIAEALDRLSVAE